MKRRASPFDFAIALFGLAGCDALIGLDSLHDRTPADASPSGTVDASMDASFDGSSSVDGALDGSSDDAGGVDGGVGDADGVDAPSPPSGITCGSSQCQTMETCCVLMGSGVLDYRCAASADECPDAGVGDTLDALLCNNQNDCGDSNLCCIQESGSIVTSSCASSCPTGQATLCTAGSLQIQCPVFVYCVRSNIGTWGLPSNASYGTCGGVAAP